MTERRTILEGKWDCRDCDTKGILGREKQCPQCGSPREAGKESEFEFDESAPGVSADDEKARALAGAGIDWFCASCGTANRGDVTSCRNCQGERDAKARLNVEPPRAPVVPVAKKASGNGKWIAAAIVGVLAIVAYWGSRTHAVQGQVSKLHWKHRLIVETFAKGRGEDWRDRIRARAPRMPVNGAGEDPGAENIGGCVRKYRETVREACGIQHVCRAVSVRKACGTEERCETRRLGNGFAEKVCRDVTKYCSGTEERCADETRYCDRRVDGDWCGYDRFAWSSVFDQTLEGADARTRWPDRAPGALDRARRTAEYEARVSYRKGASSEEAEWKIEDAAVFESLSVGSSVELELRNLGGVAAFRVAR